MRQNVADRDLSAFLDDRLQKGTSSLYAEATAWMERRLLVRVLCDTNGNKSKACQILGITRGSLRHKICQLGISIQQTVSVHRS
jgi:two-component system nitrogen regulation response regulator GlnG